MTPTQIQNTILSASLQMANLVEANRLLLVGGVSLNNIDWTDTKWYYLNINALQRQYNLGDYTSAETTAVYNCLNEKIGFDITNNSIDPNYQAPNTTITIVAGSIPPGDFGFNDFDPASQLSDGGRTDLNVPAWAGYNPQLWLISPAGTALFAGTDYSIKVTGGISLLPNGNFPEIYPTIPSGTKQIRATGYDKV